MAGEFAKLDEFIEALRAAGVKEAGLSAKVATTTSPGGDEIAFRGRIVVEGQLPGGEQVEYVEQIMPYVTSTRSPHLTATAEGAGALRAAQLALARQLRSYRGEYQGVVAAVRAQLTQRLAEAGLSVVEPEDRAAR